ncbi:MAG: FxsA family protein [Actinomycetota bacterium]
MALLVLVWVIAELVVAALVADAIGILRTVFALAACSMLGIVVAVAAGRDAFARVAERTARGQVPGDELLDGAIVLAGGTLLVVPGFIGAALGLVLLFPVTRIATRRIVGRRIRRRLGSGGTGGQTPPDDVIDV